MTNNSLQNPDITISSLSEEETRTKGKILSKNIQIGDIKDKFSSSKLNNRSG